MKLLILALSVLFLAGCSGFGECGPAPEPTPLPGPTPVVIIPGPEPAPTFGIERFGAPRARRFAAPRAVSPCNDGGVVEPGPDVDPLFELGRQEGLRQARRLPPPPAPPTDTQPR